MDKEKKLYYENATNKLLKQLDTMKMPNEEREQAKGWVRLFRESFTSAGIRNATFGRKIPEFKYYSDGLCKASSFAFINAMGSKNWALMYIDAAYWAEGPHVYLKHLPSKQVFDLTADQYFNTVIPYEYGHYIHKLDKQDMLPAMRFLNAVEQKYFR